MTVHLATSRVRASNASGGRMLATLASGVELDLDVVVFSAGIRPRDQLARDAGLPSVSAAGIVVDEGCRTSVDDVYAIGECACIGGRVYGLVAPATRWPRSLVDRLLGGAAAFVASDTSTKLKLLGVDVASFGDALATRAGRAGGDGQRPGAAQLRQARRLRRCAPPCSAVCWSATRPGTRCCGRWSGGRSPATRSR